MDKSRSYRSKNVAANYLEELEAASPPAPSRNSDFRPVHDEIPVLQNVARVFLSIVMERAGGRTMSWSKFVTDSTPHRKISTEEEIEHFLQSKLYSKKDTRR